MNPQILGIHHVTAITGDAQRNTDFYTRVLGLRLVKRTVNFNDPRVAHLYYGDGSGTPGTLLTFFVWPEGEAGRHGAGAAVEVGLTIPRASLGFWVGHLIGRGVPFGGPERRFDDQVLTLRDGDGLLLELVASPAADGLPGWQGGPIAAEHAIRGVHHVTLWAEAAAPTGRLLTESLGFRAVGSHESTTRYAVSGGGPGALLDLRAVGGFWPAVAGVGAVHHVAWRTPDAAQVHAWRERLRGAGLAVDPPVDRRYFQSIYLREPGGAILEVASDGPGMTVDEPLERLGEQPQPPGVDPEWEREAPPALPEAQ